MRDRILTALVLLACGGITSCTRAADDFQPEKIIAMERAALDRWGNGDPAGYLEIYAPEVTYFDPAVERRVDGVEAMRKYLAPFVGKIKISRYDMIGPKVQHHGDVAVLSFNLISYGKKPDGVEAALARWNSTKVYCRIEGQWKIVHEHWSFIRPELKQPVGQ